MDKSSSGKRLGLLLHRQGLAGQGRLFGPELDRFSQPDIGRHHIAGLQDDQVAGNETGPR